MSEDNCPHPMVIYGDNRYDPRCYHCGEHVKHRLERITDLQEAISKCTNQELKKSLKAELDIELKEEEKCLEGLRRLKAHMDLWNYITGRDINMWPSQNTNNPRSLFKRLFGMILLAAELRGILSNFSLVCLYEAELRGIRPARD